MRHPDREECYKYLNDYGTPEHVIGHCKSVAAVAYRLAEAINEKGGTMAPPVEELKIRKCRRAGDKGRIFYIQEEAEVQRMQARELDSGLVLAAGLLHDMARVNERHWDVSADFCEKLGLSEEAKIIRLHMQFEISNDVEHLTEIDVVCLGDRLSLEDRYAGLDRRMDYIIAKAEKNGHPEAKVPILAKKEQTRLLLEELEKRIGSIDSLMENLDYENTEG